MSKITLATAMHSVVNRVIRLGGKFCDLEVYHRETTPNLLGMPGDWKLLKPPESVLILQCQQGKRTVSIGFPERTETQRADIVAIWSGELELPSECLFKIDGKSYRVVGSRQPRLNREVFLTLVFAVSEVN